MPPKIGRDCLQITDDVENQQLRSSYVWMDNGNGFIQGRTCNRFEMEKKEYIDVVFAKHPSMIKLEWNLVEVYCKRIQLRSSFWGENCVYLLVLVFSEQQISAFILICND